MKVIFSLAILPLLATAIYGGTVSPSLQLRLDRGESVDIVISLESISDVFTSPSVLGLRGEARVQEMISTLKERTTASQRPFLQLLSNLGKESSEFQTFWVTNLIEVKNAQKPLVSALANIPGDFTIEEPKMYSLVEPTDTRHVATPAEIKQGLQWGLEKIQVQRAWTVTKGAGTVIAIIDTGVHLEHEALVDNYGGAWYDPIDNTTSPEDRDGHGTHAIGSAVGTVNGIGVAPEAKWIACRGMFSSGSTSQTPLLLCAEWLLTVSPRPNVVLNSFGTNYNDQTFNNAISAWGVANIIPVFSIGEKGVRCNNPVSPGDQLGVISVGATDRDDIISNSSSRGPGPGGRQKPEVSAPGISILSAGYQGTTSYVVKSGTTSATPHVAGAIALYISNNPTATFDEILEALKTTGDRPEVTNSDFLLCSVGEWPNMAFGYGRLNVGNLLGAP